MSASSGASAGSTASIVLPSTTTLKPAKSASDLPSNRSALVNATRELGAAEARAGALPDPAANTPSEASVAAMGE
jgi:hypothetical protein